MLKKTRTVATNGGGAHFEIAASVQTDKGCVREANEDAGRFVRPNDPALLRRKGALLIVADGMGGHSAGEVASQMAVEQVSRLYYEAPGEEAQDALAAAVAEANRRIYAEAAADENKRGMGTTCTALAIREGGAFAAHVGDSRLYMLRDGGVYQLSEDHSHVMELVRHGLLTKEEARTHEDKNVILRALGTTPEVEVSVVAAVPVQAGDRFLVCSDGLHDLVADEEIGRVVAEASDEHAACEQLIALAKERGGHDNITVGLVRVVPAGTAGAEAEKAPTTREVEAVR